MRLYGPGGGDDSARGGKDSGRSHEPGRGHGSSRGHDPVRGRDAGRGHDSGRNHDGRNHDGRNHDGRNHDGHNHDGRNHDSGRGGHDEDRPEIKAGRHGEWLYALMRDMGLFLITLAVTVIVGSAFVGR
jgi:hypothetical protein